MVAVTCALSMMASWWMVMTPLMAPLMLVDCVGDNTHTAESSESSSWTWSQDREPTTKRMMNSRLHTILRKDSMRDIPHRFLFPRAIPTCRDADQLRSAEIGEPNWDGRCTYINVVRIFAGFETLSLPPAVFIVGGFAGRSSVLLHPPHPDQVQGLCTFSGTKDVTFTGTQ